MKKGKRFLALLLSFAMVVTLLPSQVVLADGGGSSEAGSSSAGDGLPAKLVHFSFDEGTVDNESVLNDSETGAKAKVNGTGMTISSNDKAIGNGALNITGNAFLKVTDANDKSPLAGKDAITVSYYSKSSNSGRSCGWAFFAEHDLDDSYPSSPNWPGKKYIGTIDLKTAITAQSYLGGSGSTTNGEDIKAENLSNDWRKVDFVLDSGKAILYIDGIQKAISGRSDLQLKDILGANGGDIYLGKSTYNEYYTGLIDEFTVYDGALSRAQIEQIYYTENPSALEPIKAQINENGFIQTADKLSVGIGEIETIKRKDYVPEFLPITYVSSNDAIASVDTAGRITGKQNGTATITASYDGTKKEIVVTVKDAKAELTPIGTYKFENELGEGVSAITGEARKLDSFEGTVEYSDNDRNGTRAIKINGKLSNEGYGLKLPEKNLGSNYSVSMWVKPEKDLANNEQCLFLGYHDPENWLGITGAGSGNYKVWSHNALGWNEKNTDNSIRNPIPMSKNVWTMLTVSQEGNTVHVYKNGALCATLTENILETMNGENQGIYLGVNYWDTPFTGLIDDVYVYDTALNATQVASVYLKDAPVNSFVTLNGNKSIDYITEDLGLSTEVNGIPLTWTSSVPEKITATGEVKAQDGSKVTLKAEASIADIGFTWEKEFEVTLARKVTVNYTDVKTKEVIKTDALYLQEGKEYTYPNIPEIFTTETAAYKYVPDDTANKVTITVGTDADTITVAYQKMNLGTLDALEDITVIEGNTPILPKTVGATASPDDGTPAESGDASAEEVKINVPVTWNKTPDITTLKASETPYTITGNAGGKAVNVKVTVLECDEKNNDLAAGNKSNETYPHYTFNKKYKGKIVTEFDIEVTRLLTESGNTDMTVAYTDKANNTGDWMGASGPRLDFNGYFRNQVQNKDERHNYPTEESKALLKPEIGKTYRIRMEIDDTKKDTQNGAYKIYITTPDGTIIHQFENENGDGFRGWTGEGIQNFFAVRGGFTVKNHKIYWESGYATKKIEIYVGNELKGTITSKEEAGKFTYTPEGTYEIDGDENVYVLVPEKSGWTKEDGTVNTTLTESAETAAGETATYKAYYVKKANLGGLDAAIKKAEADKANAEALKVYTDASVAALQEKIDAAKAVYTKYTAEGVTEAKLQEDAVIKEVKDAMDSLSGVLVAKSIADMESFLTAHYKLDEVVTEGEGTTAVKKVTDKSGKGHDATVYGNVTADKYNGASFPGTAKLKDYIKVPNDITVTDQMTFSFWAKDERGSKSNAFGIGSGDGFGGNGSISGNNINAQFFYINTHDGDNLLASVNTKYWTEANNVTTKAPEKGTWHHITSVLSGKTLTLYVDGIKIDSTETKAAMTEIWEQDPATRHVLIGNCSYGTQPQAKADSDYKGNIKDLRIYNASLADEQVKEIYDTELTLPMQLAVEDTLKAINARTEKGEYLLDITGEGTEANINLITKGNQNETIEWTAYAADGTTVSSDVIDVAAKKVKLPQTIGEPADAVLKAVITLGEETKTITIKCTATKVANLNRTAFNTAIDKADKMVESKYTSSSWTAFVTLRTNARTNAAKATTQDALDAITASLNNAMKADGSEGSVLVLLGDKTALNASIDNAVAVKEGRNQNDYTGTYESAWDTLDAKLKAANTAKESNDVDEAAVTLAKNELDSAIAAFVNATLDMKLAAANAAKDGRDEGSYTADVWKALTDAITKAQGLKDNAEATQEQKLAACDELDAAIADFVEINKEAADKLKEEAAGKLEAAKTNKANYEEDVWNALEQAIKDYEQLGADASKADLIAAYNRINVALANFKPISKEAVAGLKNEASDMLTAAEANKADYDADVWKALEDAITAADNLKANATQTQITKAYTDLKTAMANFKPMEVIAVTGITVTPATLKLKENESGILTAAVSPSNATNKTVTWSSGNTGVATVDKATGKVTAVKAGTAIITATASGKSADCTVTVEAADNKTPAPTPTPTPTPSQKVTKVTLSKTKLTMGIKENFTLKATPTPADAVKSVSWSVDKKGSKIVKLNTKTGKITGKKKGKATVTVTVTSKDGSSITAKCAVTVKPAPKKSTKISVAKKLTLKVKGTKTLKPKVKGNFGSATFKFTSKNKKVAKVDANGKVTGVKKGKTKITITTYNKKAKTTVNVTVK